MSIAVSELRDFHARILELNGGEWFKFDLHLPAIYRAVLQPGSVAVDGGANVGVHTLRMAHAIMPGGLVIAIEPVPESMAQLDALWLEHQMPENLLRRVPCGLSSTAGEADFYQVIDPVQHELSGLRNRHFLQSEQIKKIRVELTTLDAICQNLGRVDFLKLDLEGAELDALRGGRQTLSRFRPVVALEQDQYSPGYFNYTWNDLLEYFTSLNYQVYDLFGMHYTDPSMLERCAVWDFVGLPGEYRDKDSLFGAVRGSMVLAGVKFPPAGSAESSVFWVGAPGISAGLECAGPAAACAIDNIGSVSDPWAVEHVQVSGDQEIRFSGWAVDEPNKTAAGGVDLMVDEVPYGAFYGGERRDVAVFLKNTACLASGYLLVLAPGSLPKGEHTVSLRVISRSRTSFYRGPTLKFNVE